MTMNRLLNARQIQRLVRFARVAGDIMTPNPVSIDHTAKVQQAAIALSERGISAVPVINEAGRPVGVVSRTDIVRVAGGAAGVDSCALMCADCGSMAIVPRGIRPDELDPRTCGCPSVSDIMTPEVYSIETDAPVVRIVEELLGKNVHRLFVVDHDGVLVGVVTALDVLRSFRR
jgi:CBS domain-containing protein